MNDAREVFHQLRDEGLDPTQAPVDVQPVERRIARHRAARYALAATTGLALVVGIGLGLVLGPFGTDTGPIDRPTESPTPSPTATSDVSDTREAACNPATVVSGKSVGNIGGLEGWFNGTPDAPCDEWPQQTLDHPDTVLINTVDNTMVEAYYRTSIESLGVYADLGDDFVVPNPDPTWPDDSLVLIDASTGEVLQVHTIADIVTSHGGPRDADLATYAASHEIPQELQTELPPETFAVEQPYPPSISQPVLADILPAALGATVISIDSDEIVFRSRGDNPAFQEDGEVIMSTSKGDVAVFGALDWQCAWIQEYLWAVAADDAFGASVASDSLLMFPELQAIREHNPELGQSVEVTSRMTDGDLRAGERRLATSCSGFGY